MKLLLLIILIIFSSCYVIKKSQILTGKVIAAPIQTMRGYKIKIVTEKQNWTDTQYVFVNSSKYEVGKCYSFNY